MTGFQLATYGSEHREEYLGLLRLAWGEGSMRPEEFDWWFERNPADSLRSVAESNSRVVGVAGHSFARMILGGEERLAAFSVHATTETAARGQGVFRELERKHEQEAIERAVAVVLAFASAPTAPVFLGPLGWTAIGELRIWARPLPALFRPRETLDPIGRFEHAGDAGASWPNHIVRDAAYLGWRYLDAPRDYLALQAGGGYAVLGHKVHGGLPVAYVADLAGPANSVRPLLRACLAGAKRAARAVLAVPAPEHRAQYAALGFVPTPRSLHLIGKALASSLDPDPHAWRFTLGDTDFF